MNFFIRFVARLLSPSHVTLTQYVLSANALARSSLITMSDTNLESVTIEPSNKGNQHRLCTPSPELGANDTSLVDSLPVCLSPVLDRRWRCLDFESGDDECRLAEDRNLAGSTDCNGT